MNCSRESNRELGCYDEATQVLQLSSTFLSAFAAQHPALRIFVEGVRLLRSTDEAQALHGWRTLKAGWGKYYPEVGDGEEACRHFTEASAAAGARVSDRKPSAPNCVAFALSAHIGVPSSPAASDGGIPAALNRALVGCIRTRDDGTNQAVMSAVWAELLGELGFQEAPHPIVGDIVVYTIRKAWLPAARNEFAVHVRAIHSDANPGQAARR